MSAYKGTLGSALINTALPPEYRVKSGANARDLKKSLIRLAQDDPTKYTSIIPKVKKIGDEFATLEGISVGLDDITPQYAKRNAILSKAKKKIKSSRTAKGIADALIEAQKSTMSVAISHPGDLGLQARSGSRGNVVQLMKTLASPIVVGDSKGAPIPYLIERGYSEGLSPAEAWIAGDESRSQVISGQLGTADPGDLGKILASTMNSQVIASDDCGTKNGILVDPQKATGRYHAGGSARRVSRADMSGAKKRIRARSPLTCELPKGVCQKCMGVGVSGRHSSIGTNVGVQAATTLSEPLTQMQLSAKHGISLVKGDRNTPRGVSAVRQFIEVPKSFFHKAVLSDSTGEVSAIAKAPQGGFDVSIGDTKHYVPPDRNLRVARGDSVEVGDILSSGIPSPSEVVHRKGLGAGREYLVSALDGVYSDAGQNVDRRHLELLARSQLGFVKVTGRVPGYLPGEVIPYGEYQSTISAPSKATPIKAASGKTLAEPVLHHLPGTVVSRSMLADLKEAGVSAIKVTDEAPDIMAHMAPASRTPLLNPNWMARLGHRYQKKTILEAAAYGQKADLHGYDPIPGIVFGKELTRGPKGTY